MEYKFKAIALMRITQIVDSWPAPNRNMMKALNALASKVELTEEDKAAIGWRPSTDGRTILFQADVEVAKELDEHDVEMLSTMVEDPPERLVWTRADRVLQAAIFEPLGVAPWL